MFGLKEAGVLGVSAAVAGGVAYLVWTYASSSVVKKKKQEKEDEEEVKESAPDRGGVGEEVEEEKVSATVQTAVSTSPQVLPQSEPTARTQVLVLGLDGAGKTSLLHLLATGSLEQDMQPTQGFNAVSINRDNQSIEFLEIGGKEDLRAYWPRYMSKALLLVYVVDSSSPQLFPVAKKHLHLLLASDPLLPLMVLANKQDLPEACSITELHDSLSLSEVGDRKLFLISTHMKKGDSGLSSGVQDARSLIVNMVCDGR